MAAYIVVSYARKDAAFVTPLVRFLRSGIAGALTEHGTELELVFLDSDSIPTGYDWPDAIDAAIARCERMFVFWCQHAAASQEVHREIEVAVRLGKTIVPVLLDDSKLADEIRRREGIDLRPLATHGPGAAGLVPLPRGVSGVDFVFRKFAPVLGIDAGVMRANFRERLRRADLPLDVHDLHQKLGSFKLPS